MAKKRLAPATALYPVPVVMVTCVDKSGRANIVTVTWTGTVCSEPPMIGISVRPGRFSHPMIKGTGEFVANIPSAEQLHALDYVGTISGRNCADKFESAGLTPLPAALVKAPLIKECPVNLECKVRKTLTLGTHTHFLAEVVAVGDGSNDVALLSSAGLAIAMGNALAEVKAVADHVTLDVDHSGVAAAISKYLL